MENALKKVRYLSNEWFMSLQYPSMMHAL